MILLFGYGDEPAITLTAEAAHRHGLPFLLIDQRELAGVELCVEDLTTARGFLYLCGTRLPLDEVEAVYARPLAARRFADDRATAHDQALLDIVAEWLDVAPGRIVNRPAAMTSNASKPYQAQLIAQHGFRVPDTLVTSEPAEVCEFAARHGSIVYKSVSGVRSIVTTLDRASLARIENVRALPTQFQERVPGVDVRVHVVGQETFATERRRRLPLRRPRRRTVPAARRCARRHAPRTLRRAGARPRAAVRWD